MNALHEQFVAEARELIHQATDDLIAVEREGASAERIDRIFRAFHTLKGSAGVVELPAMTLTLHAAEDLLAAIHGGRLGVRRPWSIRRWPASIRFRSGWMISRRMGPCRCRLAKTRERWLAGCGTCFRERRSREAASDRRCVQRRRTTALPEWVSRLIQAAAREHLAAFAGASRQNSLPFPTSRAPVAFSTATTRSQLMRAIPDLLAFHIEAREPWPPLADLDPYACNLRLQGHLGGNSRRARRHFPPGAGSGSHHRHSHRRRCRQNRHARRRAATRCELVRAIIEEQRQVLAASRQGDDLAGRIGAAARAAANALRHHRRADLAERVEDARRLRTTDGPTVLLSALDAALALAVGGTRPRDGGDAAS